MDSEVQGVEHRVNVDVLNCNVHQASLLTGSYDHPIDAIGHYEQYNREQDLYIDPPCIEMDLKKQLQKIEVTKDSIR